MVTLLRPGRAHSETGAVFRCARFDALPGAKLTKAVKILESGYETRRSEAEIRLCPLLRNHPLGIIRIMNYWLTLLVCSIVFLSGCSTTPKENYQQAIQSYYTQAYCSFTTLEPVDSGETVKARHMLLVPIFLGLDETRFDIVKGLASLTPKERQEWTTLARQTLDYMLLHKEDWDLRLLDVKAGLRGLRYFLTSPKDVRQLDELSDHLEAAAKKKLEHENP